MANKMFTLKLTKSLIGCTPRQRATIKGLGLRKINSTITVKDTPVFRGMIFHVQHLIEVQKGT